MAGNGKDKVAVDPEKKRTEKDPKMC